jgi:4-hydroxybenzoate polyprenyltransferase
MSIIKKFFLASRYDKPHGILLLYFPCIWGINLNDVNTTNDIFLYIIFFIGACGMRALGCLWNDFNDKDFDIKVKRTKSRLIASKKITNKTIVIFCFINGCIGSVPLYFIPINSIITSLSILPIIIIYPFMKRFTWWPQLWLGICFNWGVLVGFSVYDYNLFNLELILFYVGSVFFTIGYDTIYGFQDIKDDEKIGIKSTSIKFKSNAKLFLFIIYFIAFSFWTSSLVLLHNSILTLAIFIFLCLLILIKVLLTNTKEPNECKKTFIYNSYFSLGVIFVLIGA